MKTKKHFSLVQRLTLVALALGTLNIQSANSFLVMNTSDALVPGSLRQALTDASALGGGDILFSNVSGTITLASELVVTQNVNILGPGAGILAISGNNQVRVFNIKSNATVLISDLAIQNGSPPGWTNIFGGGILNYGSLTLVNCIISGNSLRSQSESSYGGGGLANFGTLTMTNSVLANNRGGDGIQMYPGGDGRGLYNSNTAALFDCTIRDNQGGPGGVGANAYGIFGNYLIRGGRGGHGGGIYNAGVLSLSRTTLSNNSGGMGGHGGVGNPIKIVLEARHGTGAGSGGDGGAIYNQGTLSMTNCTLNGNASGKGGDGGNGLYSDPPDVNYGGNGGDGGNGGWGGGIFNCNNMVLYACTISGNSFGQGGVGGYGGAGSTVPNSSGKTGLNGYAGSAGGLRGGGTLFNSIVAQNGTNGYESNISGRITSLGYNLIGNTNGCFGFGAIGDLVNVDPLLGPLSDNGGPTYTMALLPGSPAIDAGYSGVVTSDQRGIVRPLDLAAITNKTDGTDIGACEVTGMVPAPAGIVAWWPAEGSARDMVSTNYGTLVGSASYVTGKVGRAWSFDGISGAINLGDPPDLQLTNALTLEAWVFRKRLSTSHV